MRKAKWQIIFYPMLHPKEPRAYMETQFTNRRICVFTKHKRYNKISTIRSFYHEVLHIIFRRIFKNFSPFDDFLDDFDYKMSKAINLKKIIREKGWEYVRTTSRQKAGKL